MANTATPAAQPGEATKAFVEEGKAPPTIDSHGGKLSPITCFCGGPDGSVSLLMLLALLSTLAPRRLKAFRRIIDLSVLRLAPGLLLTALIGLDAVLSTEPVRDVPEKFQLVAPVSAAMGGGLLAISFLRLLCDALMPITGRSRARSVAAMAASGLAVLTLPLIGGIDVGTLRNDGALTFSWAAILVGYLGIPVGLALLLAWRRFNGRIFNALLLVGIVGLLFLGGIFLSDPLASVLPFLTVTFIVTADIGAGLRGMGRSNWQGLTGRMAWILSWILLVLSVMAIGMWVIFLG